ncbi:cancer-associated gene 1 protein isoform X1 [Zalophus californianus]|uniref:Cancer-associated gene 1 protein isoform X1 n=1 Tax=Zalophus californianus TaxID=9704 RepID=A0A6J2DPZ4_ZALCA|nr:cancer-associated gene 1 protein isoform X1 [Zalophus californianus]XP_027458499.1 cancer-associated gene 1 protein isoform X1 [Zalophus californianus]XP_027458500.1 cancer-associated gene 1 protein isoform X1 [Zalophus californianus]
MDVSHEKLEGMSEAEAMNLSSVSQDLTHSNSPFYMETSNTTSDLPQNEIKNAEREDESKFTLSEEIHGTLDDWLGDVSIGNDSQNLLTQPVDTSISPFRQFEPICKFHLREAFNNKMITFQNLTESLPYMKKPEMQSHVYNCAKDTNMKEDSFKEENPGGTGTSANEDQLAHKCVTQPSRSPPLVHSGGETLKFMEMSLPKSASVESALKPSQPESFLYKENVHRDVEKPFYKENSFNLFDLRANYTTDEIAVSSKGIQSFGDVPEMPVCLHKEVAMGDVDRPGTVSPWSPSWSGGASPEDSKMPDPKQSLESSQPLEEDMDLTEVLRKLQHTNKQQQIRIQDLQSSNKYLEKKIEELQKQTTKQQVFVDIINKLKAKVEELIEDKYRVMLEKSDTDKTLQNLHEVLTHTQKHLQEARNEKETLQLELKKIKGNYVHLQERYMTEMQQKAKTVSQCLEMDRILSEKEEVEKQQQLKRELEKATTSALDLLKREKKAREQEILSLYEEFQKHKKKNLEERQELKSTLKKLIVQVSHLQLISDTEKAENTQLQQQVTEVKQENERLWQQVARSREQNDAPPQFETPWLTEHSGEAVMADITKDAKTVHSNLLLNCSPGEEESLSPPDVKRTSQLVSRIHSLLALMVGLLTLQLLEHKDRITAFRELIAKEKAFQDQVIEVTSLDSGEAKNIRDVPVLLGVKLNKYHNLNEELDFLIAKLRNLLESEEDHCNRLIEENDKHQRHLGNLINKVTSYEEIIECADQRLTISHSQTAYLEERNKHLEDLIRRPRESKKKTTAQKIRKSSKVLDHDEASSASDHHTSCNWEALPLKFPLYQCLHFISAATASCQMPDVLEGNRNYLN